MNKSTVQLQINGKALIIDGRSVGEFEFLDKMKLRKVLVDKGSTILFFDNAELFLNDRRRNRNIAEFDATGALVWLIQECPHNTTVVARPYDGVRMTDDGRLIAGNWIGVDYEVNRVTGEVTPFGHGRPW